MERIKWKGESRTDYKGIMVQQNPNVFNEFEKFFKKEKFDYIIEIGTSYGGLSLFLHDQSIPHKFNFITYDWSGFKGGSWNGRRFTLKENFNNKIPFDFRDKNVFEDSTIKEISEILINNKCLLLCDGGDKPKEFRIFSKYLTNGSYIMAHDYARDKDYFNREIKGKVWDWLEIQDSDIQLSIDKENLIKSSYYDDFSSVVWVQYLKKNDE